MNKTTIVIATIVIGLLLGSTYIFLNQRDNDKTWEEYEYIPEHCDKLLHKNVPWAVCYKKDKVIATIQYGNIYEATETKKYDYDKIEVFNKVGGSVVIATYEGKLYFDIKPKCKQTFIYN